ncbi:hypothetical protein [Terrisporobacter muris]|uniref:Uncharacterized protein n=1 Tax=Terrisporobacter muris TaxID=2963284 RepID=A0A9X2M6U1_9FIRM|nr:hypothetical protein [Terrisporobacter muris]MCR1821268.1 hypothetical protein [Terrisporobacter muris]
MLKAENIEVYGWEGAVRGARNPMNSWDRIDSKFYITKLRNNCKIGPNDYKMLKNLCIAGKDHRKWMRMVIVTMDITAPLYWWKEFDTYKVGTVANSCSTMHKIHAKEFTLNDFSHEHLNFDSIEMLELVLIGLNSYREEYLETKDKNYWWQLIQMLPSSYNQKRTVQLNYEVLNTIYHARKNHKLDEWHTLCDVIKELPYSEFITMDFKEGLNE